MAKPAVTRHDPEPLPEAMARYYPDTKTLVIHTDERWSEGETIARDLVVFYDEQDNVIGFTLESAEFLLGSFVAVIRAQSEQ